MEEFCKAIIIFTCMGVELIVTKSLQNGMFTLYNSWFWVK